MQKLKRCLTMRQGVGILVSTLLGSGIFIVPAIATTIAGVHVTIAWLLMLVLMIPVAFTFSNLGIVYPNAGGTSFFVKQALGRRAEHFTAWLYLSVMPLGPPVVIITGASYIGAIFDASNVQLFCICAGMLLVMLLLNFIGLAFVGKVQTILSVVIVVSLLGVILIGFCSDPTMYGLFDLSMQYKDFAVITQAVPILFWCFVGLEAVVHLSSEFTNVERDFPKVILISMVIVGGICFFLSLIVLHYGVYGNEVLDSNYMVPLLNKLVGGKSMIFIGIMGFLTCFSSINIYILSFSRMMLSMSEEKIIAPWFGEVNRSFVPLHSLYICYLCVFFTIGLKYALGISLADLICYANSVFVFLYLLASLAGGILLRHSKRKMSILSAVFCCYIYYSLGLSGFYAFAVLLFSFIWDVFVLKKESKVSEDSVG